MSKLKYYRILRIAELSLNKTSQKNIVQINQNDESVTESYPWTMGKDRPILVGKLKTGLGNWIGIVLQDVTGTIGLKFTYWNTTWLQQHVVIYSWNYIPAIGKEYPAYLEVTSDPLLLTDQHFLMNTFSFSFTNRDFDLELALFNRKKEEIHLDIDRLLQKYRPIFLHSGWTDFTTEFRKFISKAPSLSVLGRISAKSPIFQIQNDIFFFVELDCWQPLAPIEFKDYQINNERPIISTHLIFHGPDAVSFYDMLKVENYYLFTDMTASSLKLPPIEDVDSKCSGDPTSTGDTVGGGSNSKGNR